MDFNMEERKQQIAKFSAFIDESFFRIDEILHSVGWTREHLMNEDVEMVSCPLNPEHKVPKKSLDSHVHLCSWRREGYHELDVPLPENSVANSESTKSSIVIDAPMQATIIKEAKEQDPTLQTGNLETGEYLVPKTSNRLIADFTSDERRVLYDYVISKTKPVEDVKVEELQMIGDMKRDDQPRPKSKLEILIEQRDAKRRRISYRKKVHTNRKSHTEVLREVIQNQMELLEQIIKEECDEDKDEVFSLGGDEVNLLSNRYRDKRHCVLDNVEGTLDRERNNDQKMIKKEMRDFRNYQESNGSVPDDAASGYDRNEQSSRSWSERSKSYRETESNSSERKERNEKQEYKSYKMMSTSFDDKTSREQYYMHDYKGWERSRGYRTYDRVKGDNYRQSRRDYEDWGETSQSRKRKNHSKPDSPEQIEEYRRDYESRSRRHKSSKHGTSGHDLEYEKEYRSRSKRHKYSSKYDMFEHDVEYEEEYEIRKSYNKFKDISKRDDFHDRPSDGYKNNLHKGYYDESKTSRELGVKSFKHKEIEIKVEKEENAEDFRKYSEKLKKPKKKKKKHHKHKGKKKLKRKSSTISSSNSSSERSDTDDDSDSA